MDIYERLMADHARQRGLVRHILQRTADPAEAFCLLLQLREEVAVHQAAEEQTLYAAILAISKDSTKVRGSVLAHDALARQFDRLTEPPPGLDVWRAGLADLAKCLCACLCEEETTIFADARSLIGAERARALGERFDLIREVEADFWGNATPIPVGLASREPAAAE